MKKIVTLLGMALVVSALILGCKKDKNNNPSSNNNNNNNGTSTSKKYVLVIDNGAQTVPVGKTMPLSAHLVSKNGEVVIASNVKWSTNAGTISGNNFVAATTETLGTISASVQYEGQTYTDEVPVSVQPLASTLLFGVVPSAIIWSVLGGDIPLTTVYLGTQSSSFAFESNNPEVASVSSAGVVSFHKAGSAVIKVTATIGGQTSIINVPIMVIGEPEIPLPVTRVVVTPALGEMFRGESLQFTAKAYNSKGDDVTNTVTFSYAVEEKKMDDEQPDNLFPIPVTVDASGKVTAQSIGGAYIKATANGITGQAEIVVNPDTIIMVSPFFVQLGGMVFDPNNPMNPPTNGPSEQTFTAQMKKIDRNKYRQKDPNFLIDIPNPSDLQWYLPEDIIPDFNTLFGDIFKVVTLSNKTTTSVKATKIDGKSGGTSVIAQSGIYGGAASVFVMP